MSDFFQEVTEELRSDQLRELWRRFGKYVIGIAVAIVIVTIVNEVYSEYRTTNLEAVAERYLAATDLIAADEQEAALLALSEIADEDGGGFGILARLEEAGIYARSGETENAIAAYTEIAEDGGVPARFQQYAALTVALHLIRTNDFDDATAWLAPLMSDKSIWRIPATELYAFALFSRGDRAAAHDIYQGLLMDPLASENVKARVTDMVAITNSVSN